MKKHRIMKKVTAIALAAVFSVAGSAPAMASALDNARQEKAKAEENLNSVNSDIQNIRNKQNNLQSEINALDADLVTTIANISIIEDEIVQKEAELQQANDDLVVAKETEAEQYASMKERISYMYINGSEISFFNALLGANDFADALKRVQVFNSVYKYDRNLLEEYQETEAQIAALIDQIAEEEADMKEEQRSLEEQKSALDTMIAQKSAQMDNFGEMLASAQALAAQYKSAIEEQNRVIAKEVEAQQRAEAEARAREQAAQQAAAAQNTNAVASVVEKAAAKVTGESKSTTSAKSNTDSSANADTSSNKSASSGSTTQNTANNNTANNTASSSNSSNASGNTTSDSGTSKSSTSSGSSSSSSSSSSSTSSGSSSSSSGSSSGSSSSGSGSGQSVANYACNFVGNPYVWGGESLTNGADCSGFVKAVYAHFGVSLPHSSASLRSVGRAVSASEMQPGDIICYSGHVAIYIGGGSIVHASNEATGIKISSNYAYKPVLAIRRIF